MIIAIDGGGTKTEYRLVDDTGKMLASVLGAGTNHDYHADDWAGVEKELSRAIQELICLADKQADVQSDKQITISAGISGLDTGIDQKNIEECFAHLGFENVHVYNDGFLPLFAEVPDACGIALNCGTGVCCVGRDEKGSMVKLAGLDDWSGDAGNGGWIILTSYRLTYETLVLREKCTPWTEKYMAVFGLKDEKDLINFWSVIKDVSNTKQRHRAIRLFFEAYEEGMPEIQPLITQMQECLIDNILAVTRRLAFETEKIPVILSGSVLTKAASLRFIKETEDQLNRKAKVSQQCRRDRKAEARHNGERFVTYEFRLAKKRPVEGAVLYSRFAAVESRLTREPCVIKNNNKR